MRFASFHLLVVGGSRMEKFPCPVPVSLHRRGSTPSLVQFATINAQLRKEKVSPSLEVINHDDDEDRDIGARSLSQPALNILHVTNVKGKLNSMSITPCFTGSSKRSKIASKLFKDRKKHVEKLPNDEAFSSYLKRSSSHGVLGTGSNIETEKRDSVVIANIPNINNRRNTWCQ